MLVSFPYSHFMGGVKWNIPCHIHKDVTSICDSGLPKCEFLRLAGKQWASGPVPFATQRIQECHSPSLVGGVSLSP